MASVPPALAEAFQDRYHIERELGHGGMATVYLADDKRHDRRVALKILRPELVAIIGPQRFLSEIKLTANLQHPHILPLHDSGEADPFLFYVMPFVQGESLRDRIARQKQLPVNDAVRIATEVASALDYAHRHGVIHRDIKPENILLHEGQALVADFGIALAVSSASGTRMTETGLSLGTPHYMSPEQAMGEREITACSDIYALGCVLYEMLTGDPPFTGSTAQAIVARVLTEAPRPLIPQRHTVPAHIEAAVLTALEKLPADRFASAAEFAEALASPSARTPGRIASTAPPRSRQPLAWATTALLGVALLGIVGYRLIASAPSPSRLLRASLLTPGGCDLDPLGANNLVQLSPQGRDVAFVASCEGESSLWVRSLATGEARRLTGTSNAAYPFWSPDGGSIGFFADEQLKRIDLESGAVRKLTSAPDGRGGTWNRKGSILYAPDLFGPLYLVSAAGGEPEQVTFPPKNSTDVTHRMPHFLPDGLHFLYVEGHNAFTGVVRTGELGSPETSKLLDLGANVVYARGYLLYVRDGILFAQSFDPARRKLSGSPLALVPRVETAPFRWLGNYSASAGDLLVYREPVLTKGRIDWFDPVTRKRKPVLDSGAFDGVDVSPDGRRILLSRHEGDSPLVDLWTYELGEGTWTRVSGKPAVAYVFAWAPDGTRVAFQDMADSSIQIVSVDRNEASTVTGRVGSDAVLDWAPDGSYAVGVRQVRATGWDLTRTIFTREGARTEVLYATSADENLPRISPDGHLLAYTSNRTGRGEVYLTRLPEAKVHWQVSQNGAAAPQWSRDGRSLYFLGASQELVSASIMFKPNLRIGRPTPVAGAPEKILDFDTGPKGQLLVLYESGSQLPQLTLIENWSSLLTGQ